MRSIASLPLLTLLLVRISAAADWPGFRGPDNRGVSMETNLPLHWGPDQNIKWSVKLPGPGNGSPVVANGQVVIVGSLDQGRQRTVTSFDRRTGDLRWEQSIHLDAVEETHQTNPHGATTPATDGERIVVWHGSAGVHCYDFQGNLLWSRDLGTFAHIWGYASSPIIHRGKVFQLCGPGERQFLAALDLATGKVLWEQPEPGGSHSAMGRYIGSWATPLIVTIDGREQVLCGMPTRVIACDPDSGEILWYVSGVSSDRSDLMYTSPLVSDRFAVAMGGFGGPALGFELGGTGDVTAANRKWHEFGKPRNPQRIGSGMIVGDFVYMANADNQGSLECRELRTGTLRWEVARTNGGPHWGSILLADGRLYATGQKGVTRVFAPNPDRYEELAVNDLGEQTHATPAISDGEFFIRTWEKLYCIADPQSASN